MGFLSWSELSDCRHSLVSRFPVTGRAIVATPPNTQGRDRGRDTGGEHIGRIRWSAPTI